MPTSTPIPPFSRNFASDNNAGIAPEILEAICSANTGHCPSYGDDEWTHRASDAFRAFFGMPCEVFFVFNGTAANSLALAHLCPSFMSIVCHSLAHIETDECGAPEFFSSGAKVLLADGPRGKILPENLLRWIHHRSDIHFPRPRVLSLTQATEMATVYSPDEVGELCSVAKKNKMLVHMDGARFWNALASLHVPPAEITWKQGVDVLCFGGTKNGLPGTEAVVFFDRELAVNFDRRCKQAGQLASKMRFLTAPWLAALEDGLGLRLAAAANRMAARLHALLADIPGVVISHAPEANAVFLDLPPVWADLLRKKGWRFYQFIGNGSIRLMCSWDTAEAEVEAFARDVRELSEAASDFRISPPAPEL